MVTGDQVNRSPGFVVQCRDHCPLSVGWYCTRASGHEMPHRVRLHAPHNRPKHECIEIEWRPTPCEDTAT